MKNKIIFISNRLPITATKTDSTIEYKESIGGLATGLNSIHKDDSIKSLWMGWCGLTSEEVNLEEKKEIKKQLASKYDSHALFLSQADLDAYYYGFSNETIWPLFHYFTEYTHYDIETWNAYKRVNLYFFEEIKKIIEPDDMIWIHDYQLMLLPSLIKEAFPHSRIGFFLHIPFPSFEIFRLLPYRKEILEGILGSDLVGFHTYDYVRHFLSSVRRLLGFESSLGTIQFGNRIVKGDVFPMGIDYEKYNLALDNKEVRKEIEIFRKDMTQSRFILSIDRLDYTKGILQRLESFSYFLEHHPEYKEMVTLILIIAPSRDQVPQYQELKKDVEIHVSRINGEYGSLHWHPVVYFYKSFSFEKLTALYSLSDILMVTPKRDGMNLIAKEYIATRRDKKGVLILSDTAGAASELGEAIIVNPNNIDEISLAIETALDMPEDIQMEKNAILHDRLKRYTVEYWADDFIKKLEDVFIQREKLFSRQLTNHVKTDLIKKYKSSKKRLIFLDYDGTLMDFQDAPGKAIPDETLLKILKSLAENEKNEVVIISGRDRYTLGKWLGNTGCNLVAGHGVWIKEVDQDWRIFKNLDREWKDIIRPILEVYTNRTPGSIIEEKDFSIAWHYRKCEPELANVRVSELKAALNDFTANLKVGVLDGNKVLEVKDITVNKGQGGELWLHRENWDFVFAAGDDWTDEDLFSVLPESSYSIKIGYGITRARYYVKNVIEMKKLLSDIIAED